MLTIIEIAAAILMARGAMYALQKFIDWRSVRAWRKRVRQIYPTPAPAHEGVLKSAALLVLICGVTYLGASRYEATAKAAADAEHLRECALHVLPPPPPAVMSDFRGIPCN